MTVNATFDRPPADLIGSVSKLGAATLYEAMGQKGALCASIKPIYRGMKLCGPALTVDCNPADNLMVHYALTLAEPGDVLIIDFKAFIESGPWGDVLTTAAMAKGVAGVVINGSVRDAADCHAMGFPVFARGTCMKGSTKLIPGNINLPIEISNVPIVPGDIVVGDDDGVVIVPLGEVEETLSNALAREEKEEELRNQLKVGKTTVELLGLEATLRSHGIL